MSMITATTSTQTLSFDEIVEQAVQEKQRDNDVLLEKVRHEVCDFEPMLGYDSVTGKPLTYNGPRDSSHLLS